MRTLLKSLLALCLFSVPMASFAQNNAAESKEAATQILFKELPVTERLEDTPQQMSRLYAQNPFGIPESQNEKILSAYEEAFVTDSLLANTRQTFQNNYDPKMADATMEWIQTENTQRVLEAEKEFYTLQGLRKQVIRKYELEQNSPSPKRRELINMLIRNKSEGQSAVESGMIIFRGMLAAMNNLNGGQLFDSMQMQTINGNYQSQSQSQINQDLMSQYLVMYYELDDETLKNYGSFFDTETGNWLGQSLSESMHSAYEKAVSRLQKSIQSK